MKLYNGDLSMLNSGTNLASAEYKPIFVFI